jgi:Mrp family chromosome partitioning ATPase
MARGLIVLSELWRHRKDVLLPTLLVPLLAIGFSLSQPPVYHATALLQLDTGKAKSPLLQKIDEPGHAEALARIIKGDELLKDTAHDAGMRLDPRRIELNVLNDRLIRIGYSSPQKLGLESLVDALAYNFIYEILAPERLRIEQRLATTSQELKDAQGSLDNPTPPQGFDHAKAEAQVKLLSDSYDQLLGDLNQVYAAFDRGNPNALLWFAEPARVDDRVSWIHRLFNAAASGLVLGLAAGLALAGWQRMRPRGFKNAQTLSLYTQLPVVGQVPNLGPVEIVDGKAQVSVGPATLDPSGFSEIVRLQRALMRNLHGALVLTGATGHEGVSLLSILLALRSASGEKRTLLVDLNLKDGAITEAFGLEPRAWDFSPRKGARRAVGTPLKGVIAENVGGTGLDVLPLPDDKATLEALSQPGGAAALLDGLSAGYEHIVVDTSPIGALNRGNVDPLTLAAAAPRSAMVALMRRTDPARVKAAADALVASGADVCGLIANNLKNPSPKALLMDMCGRMQAYAPGLSHWLRAKAIKAGLE